MPLATQVKLPRTLRPTFPDRCVVSGLSSPGESVQFKVDSLSVSSTYAASQDGAVSVIDVPVRAAYKSKLRRQRKIRFALYAVYGIVGATIAMNVGGWLERDLSRLQIMLAIVVGLSPVFVLQLMYPPAFAVAATGNSIEYDFRSAEYAREFEALNTFE